MVSLLIFIGVCFSAALLGSVATNASIKTWYPTIKKPSWNPPNWVFAPVWSTLYLMMAIAGRIVWERGPHQGLNLPIILFSVQLILNALWSVIFFGLRKPGWACIEIAFLWISILAATMAFWNVDWVAGALMIPYLLWVSFASFLNFTIWHLNK